MIKVLFVLASLIMLSSTLYTEFQEGKETCFIEEVGEDTPISASFSVSALSSSLPSTETSSNIQMKQKDMQDNLKRFQEKTLQFEVSVKDANKRRVFSQNFGREGRFVYRTKTGGPHQICFSTATSSWFNPIQMKLDIEFHTGSSAVDYDSIAKKDHLDGIQVRVRKLTDELKDIRTEQRYQKRRESSFMNITESTQSRVFWWSIIQAIIALGAMFGQAKYLERFFRKTKLI